MASPVGCTRCSAEVPITEPNARITVHQLVEPYSPEWPAQALVLHAAVLCRHCTLMLRSWLASAPPDLQEPF